LKNFFFLRVAVGDSVEVSHADTQQNRTTSRRNSVTTSLKVASSLFQLTLQAAPFLIFNVTLVVDTMKTQREKKIKKKAEH
jgi:hypothetical protein